MTRMLPDHDQHWPTKLLPRRLEEYVFDDGRPPSQNRAFAKKLTGAEVLAAIQSAKHELKLTDIDDRYYVGTCFHESGAENEFDTEIASPSCHEGFVSVGAYQIGREEATSFGFTLADMLDLGKSSLCFVQLAERNRRALRNYAGLGTGAADPDYTDDAGDTWIGGTMRAYLGIAHNHGLGFSRRVIQLAGMDWGKYKLRNPTDNIVAHRYGEDCVTGGPYWPGPHAPANVPKATPVDHRELKLMVPFMHGEDIREVQRHVGADPDADYGPKTYRTVKAWQLGHGLPGTGVVDTATWTALLKAE